MICATCNRLLLERDRKRGICTRCAERRARGGANLNTPNNTRRNKEPYMTTRTVARFLLGEIGL